MSARTCTPPPYPVACFAQPGECDAAGRCLMRVTATAERVAKWTVPTACGMVTVGIGGRGIGSLDGTISFADYLTADDRLAIDAAVKAAAERVLVRLTAETNQRVAAALKSLGGDR